MFESFVTLTNYLEMKFVLALIASKIEEIFREYITRMITRYHTLNILRGILIIV